MEFRWRYFALVVFITSLIILLVVDAILKPCTAKEREDNTLVRLFCEGVIPGNISVGMPLSPEERICSSQNDTFSDWQLNPETGLCESQSSCLKQGVHDFSVWILNNTVLGFFVNIFVFAISALILIPGIILTIASGAAFAMALGLGVGTAVAGLSVWLGALVATIVSFYATRYLFRDHVRSFIEDRNRLKAIDMAVRIKGQRIIMLLRFSPIIPFGIFNYLMGTTSARFRDHFFATAIGILPGTVAYAFVGAALTMSVTDLETVREEENGYIYLSMESCENKQIDRLNLSLLLVGILFTLIAMIVIANHAKKELKTLLEENGIESTISNTSSDEAEFHEPAGSKNPIHNCQVNVD
uniref:VTT domain-containing protein n=1 Tax=Aplanochytrium stocchinoi TaxID=215587 RepID=A0A7S3LKT8_9STRA|mmetsp:Transcript_9743/g.12174  ORF Transcript_9743/g.12174 Transcript_9743/m.12174 type:complete len:356 (+) Transcript_9743:181-1248(+)